MFITQPRAQPSRLSARGSTGKSSSVCRNAYGAPHRWLPAPTPEPSRPPSHSSAREGDPTHHYASRSPTPGDTSPLPRSSRSSLCLPQITRLNTRANTHFLINPIHSIGLKTQRFDHVPPCSRPRKGYMLLRPIHSSRWAIHSLR